MTMTANHALTMRHPLATAADVRRFMLAGNATLTFVGRRDRFTFKFRQPDTATDGRRPTWVRLLSSARNEGNYEFVGTLWTADDGALRFVHGRKSRLAPDHPAVVALAWVLRRLAAGALGDALEVWHEGRCGRCGRKLTVPESLAQGFGPECATLVQGGQHVHG
jgi:hypothetical protein